MSLVADPIRLTWGDVDRLGRDGFGHVDHIFLHWTGGHYGHVYDDYHLCIDWDGSLWVPPDGAGANAFSIFREHTWHRNTGSIAIAMCGAFGATATSSTNIDFGPEPPTSCQIEYMAKVVGVLCGSLQLGISPRTVLTHCEAAIKDGYGPGSMDPQTRWDLWSLPGLPFHQELYPGGDLLRAKARGYLPGSPQMLNLFRRPGNLVDQREEVNEEWQSTKTLLNAA